MMGRAEAHVDVPHSAMKSCERISDNGRKALIAIKSLCRTNAGAWAMICTAAARERRIAAKLSSTKVMHDLGSATVLL